MPSHTATNLGVHLTALFLHPIKSCGRVEVERATIGPYGLVGDREWQLVAADGTFVTQRKHPQLATVRPTLGAGGIVVDGLAIAAPAAADVSAPTYTGDVVAGDAGDDAADWFMRFLGEPGFPPLFGDDQMGFSDGAQLLVVNEASHRFLADRAVEPFGIERWRANIVVDGADPWVEDTWRSIRVGTTDVRLRHPWPRCVVPQVDQDTGDRHREPALVLKKHRWCAELPTATPILQTILCGNALFGMTASASAVGTVITVGDEVEVLATDEALLRM
jgi:uncharacterized protein YcbX